MTRFTLAGVFDTVARAVPDQEVMVWRDRRLRYRDMNARIDGVAHFLVARGLGCHTERAELACHESGQDHIGLYLRNGNEYLECMVAGSRARAVPFNVNYRYVDEELRYLLADAGARALVYQAEFAPHVAAIRDRLPGLEVLVQVADESGHPLLPGAVGYESIVTTAAPSRMPEPDGDDLFLIYTGGTTGMPKGVLWRQHDVYLAAMGGTPFGTTTPFAGYPEIADLARQAAGGVRFLMTAPFIHGAAQWSAFHVLNAGGTIVLPDGVRQLDWADVLRTIERERVVSVPVVGDAMARPMVEEIETGRYDLSGLVAVSNGGAPLTPAVRARLLAALPEIVLLDAVGSSETGIQMSHFAGAQPDSTVFTPDEHTTVLDESRRRELRAGEGEGWLATHGRVPLGYLGDPDRTAATFPVLGGRRYSVPGDRAVRLGDGSVRLLGRAATTINSGGEKIFAEEVERGLAAHPAVRDVLVVGRPSARWGSEVVAIVVLSAAVSDEELLAECRRHVAGYKAPKAILRRPEIVRSPSGKADYRWARRQAAEASRG